MPACSIVKCGARKNENHPQLSLHKFPKEERLRKMWLEAIGEENINRKHKIWHICSLHFEERCFNRTLDVMRLHENCVPTEFLMELDNQAQVEIQVCRVCLALDVKMFDLEDFNLNVMFKNVTGISEYDKKESIRHRVCWECAARLTSAAAFRNKALLCDALLKNIAHMNKSDIAKLKHKYRSFLKSPLINRTVFTSSDIGCEDIRPDHKEMEILTDETQFGDDESLANIPMETDVGSSPIAENNTNFQTKHLKRKIFPGFVHFDDSMSSHSKNAKENSDVYNNNNVLNDVTVMTKAPLSENKSNIQIIHMNSEIFSAPTDTTENSEVYYSNNDKVLCEDDVMTNAPINDDCYVVIVVRDDENSPKLDVVGDTVNESICEEDTQSLEVASANNAKKMTIRKVEASCEQENGLNVGEKQKIITLKEKCFSLAEISEETGKSLTVQNTKIVNRLNNQLLSKDSKHITIQDKSPQTCNVDIKDDYGVFLTEDITDKDDDGLNDPGINDPGINDAGFYDPGFYDGEIADTVVLNDIDDPYEEENVLCDKENYSSDDSTPLENCKANKIRTMKEKADKTAKRMKKVKVNDELIEPFFTITDLTLEEQMAEIAARQKSSNYKNSLFKCSMCFKGFVDENAYNIHMLRHTDHNGEHECKICKMRFKNPHWLHKHTFLHSESYSCNQCTYVTKNRQTATLHARWHMGIKYRCPHCPEEFDQWSTYMSHLRIKHPSDFACEICGYSFVSAKGREQHKNLKHPFENVQIPEDGPLCELCNVKFVSSEAHQRHLSVSAKHNTDNDSREPNQPKRPQIKKVNSDERRRRRAKYRQKVVGPIPCEQCGVELKGSSAYHAHFRRMHPDKNRTNFPAMKYPCMCEVCGRMFQSTTHLKDHTLLHMGGTALNCETCGKAFRTKHYLMMHQRLHSPMRPSYECTLCGKSFSNYSNRQRHLLTHTGVRPFKCDICGKGFKVPGEMRTHINYVHLKKPWPKRNRDKRGSETSEMQR